MVAGRRFHSYIVPLLSDNKRSPRRAAQRFGCRMGWILFALLIGVPLIEIFLFVEVGGLIGTWPTIGLVVATAIAGSIMLRAQGARVLQRAQEKLNRGEPPVTDMLDGIGLLLAGALLLTPGFMTDAVGFAMLLPLVRQWLAGRIWAHMKARGQVHMQGGHRGGGHRGGGPYGDARDTVIDGEFSAVDPEGDGPDRQSGPDRIADTSKTDPKPGGDSPWRPKK